MEKKKNIIILDLKFNGEYLNGKIWNGKRYNIDCTFYFEIKNWQGYIKEYNGLNKIYFKVNI